MNVPVPEPRVAILLATYNGAAHIDAQVTSILWQRSVRAHIFARDDGSTDTTRQCLRLLAERHPDQLTIIDDAAGATGSATANFFQMLASIDLAAFDFVALADQDDVWMPDKLRRATMRMADTGADGYSSDLLAYDEPDNRGWVLRKAGGDARFDYLFQGASAGCTYVLSRRAADVVAAVLRVIPALPFAPSHDWILYAICRSRGLGWIRDPHAEIVYRQHGANDYGARPGWRGLAAKLQAARSSWYRDHIVWLQHVIAGTADEQAILAAVDRRSPGDRLALARRAAEFRRNRRDVTLLRATLLAGLL